MKLQLVPRENDFAQRIAMTIRQAYPNDALNVALEVVKALASQPKPSAVGPRQLHRTPSQRINDIITITAEVFCVPESTLRLRGRAGNTPLAKRMIWLTMVTHLKMTRQQVAEWFNMHPSTVSEAIKVVDRKSSEWKLIQSRLDKLWATDGQLALDVE